MPATRRRLREEVRHPPACVYMMSPNALAEAITKKSAMDSLGRISERILEHRIRRASHVVYLHSMAQSCSALKRATRKLPCLKFSCRLSNAESRHARQLSAWIRRLDSATSQ